MTQPGGDTTNAPRVEMHRGQLRFAERLAEHYGGRLRYAHGIGWHVWDGMRWGLDLDDYPRRAVVDLTKAALREMPDLAPQARLELLQDVRKCESSGGQEGVLKIAAALHPITVHAGALDRDPWLFNTQNGTFDLTTGELKPHDPTDLITKVAGCGVDLPAESPVFNQFIQEILPNDDVRAFVQRLFGSAMSGVIRDHILPIFIGEGNNGKSTLVELIRDTFGDYALAAEPELLMMTPNYTHPTGQADLLGVRLATTVETEEGRSLAASTVKRLTGGDKIRARKMRENFFEFMPSHTIVMVTNKLPKVRGDDPAMWRRVLAVPFEVVVKDINKQLPETLRLHMPAVLAWVVEGFRSWALGGLEPPDAVKSRTDEYHASSDPVRLFLDECTMATPAGFVRPRDLYNRWQQWAQDSGERPLTQTAFGLQLARIGVDSVIIRGSKRYVGIMLYSDEDAPENTSEGAF